MTWYIYPPMVALDQYGQPVNDATGQIYAEDDETGTTPLAIRDLNELTISSIEINAIYLTQGFQVEDHPEVNWRSGDIVVPLSSPKGMRLAAEAAAAASQSAQIAAAASSAAALAAQAAAEDAAGGPGGSTGGSGVGNLVMIQWDGVGTQPGRIYPVGHDLAGGTIPSPPEAYVRWKQPTYPLGVALDGDEYSRTG